MLISEIIQVPNCPHVQGFLKLLDMHFYDARAMLKLPLPNAGIDTGCNLALSAHLCNILSGISTTIYKPAHLLHKKALSKYGSGAAFRELVQDFFPFTPQGISKADFSKGLYESARNPLVHSVAAPDAKWTMTMDFPRIVYKRVLHSLHPDSGWTDGELNDLERGGTISVPCVEIDGKQWHFHADPFYLELINLLRNLAADATQIQAAEVRFQQKVMNWLK